MPGNNSNANQQLGKHVECPYRPHTIKGLKSKTILFMPASDCNQCILLLQAVTQGSAATDSPCSKVLPFLLFGIFLSYTQDIGNLYCLKQVNFYWVSVVYP